MSLPFRVPLPARFGLCLALLGVLAACGQAGPPAYQGYFEGEYLYLSAPQGGYLKSLDAPRGARVAFGQTVAVVASDPDEQMLAEVEAKATAARERVANLRNPRRSTEVAALEASLRAAQAEFALADAELQRQVLLLAQHFVPQSVVDRARAARDASAAQAEAARQQVATYRLSLGREAELRGAQADVSAAEAAAAQQRWMLARKSLKAPADGEVAETYYRPGEWVPAGSAVVSLLPDARRRLRFFVPEDVVARVKPGDRVEARCDGCLGPLRATVEFVSPLAEYTPPVIYSRGTREKLVFRVDARPDPKDAAALRPGLPADVILGTSR